MSETFSFRFRRADWVALSSAVARRPLLFRLAVVVAMLSATTMVMSVVSSSDPAAGTLLVDAMRGGSEWYPFYIFFGLVVVGTLFRHVLVGFNAAMGFARMPLADKDMTVELGDTEVHVSAPDFGWRFPWAAVSRVSETPTHLILATSGREGLPIPRSTFADAEAFEKVRAFVLAHLAEGAVHERV
ncbi:MAG: YcxB family protein [Siculibacillus sp.]|nr:YcxB family protein [Siculibacillus sp.]